MGTSGTKLNIQPSKTSTGWKPIEFEDGEDTARYRVQNRVKNDLGDTNGERTWKAVPMPTKTVAEIAAERQNRGGDNLLDD